MNKLKVYELADIEFNIISHLNGELELELGDDNIELLDDCSDDDILEWAEENEYLDDDTFTLEDGSTDINALRNLKQEEESGNYWENPPTYATPSGRAYQWFEDLNITLPQGIYTIDGDHPGNNSYGVTADSIDNLVKLQQILEDNSIKVNFIAK